MGDKAEKRRQAAAREAKPATGSYAFPLNLADLAPQFVRWEKREHGFVRRIVQTIAEAMGVQFLCPLCFIARQGPNGTHQVICWSRSRGVPEDARPGPGRWALDGTGLDDLTLNADPPNTARSVKLEGGCNWHGHITKGVVT